MVMHSFCGIRVTESSKVVWGKFDIKNRKILIDAEVSKIGVHRYVEIPDNAYRYFVLCMECLGIRAKDNHKVVLPNYEQRLRMFRGTLSVELPTNVLRHSFGSYHSAVNDISKTRKEMGHIGSENTFYNSYRELVTKEQGLKYFDIYPMKKTKETFDYQKIKSKLMK